MSFQTL